MEILAHRKMPDVCYMIQRLFLLRSVSQHIRTLLVFGVMFNDLFVVDNSQGLSDHMLFSKKDTCIDKDGK